MGFERPIFLRDLIDHSNRLSLPALAQELSGQSDMDPVLLLLHDRLLAAGKDLEQVLPEMGFEGADRDQYGKSEGGLSETDPGGQNLSRHMRGQMGPAERGLLYYAEDLETGVRVVERSLENQGKPAMNLLLPFLLKTGLYPEGTQAIELKRPLEVGLPYQKLKLQRTGLVIAKRWAEQKMIPKKNLLDSALARPLEENPSPLQVAALLTPFVASSCAEIADMGSYSLALAAAHQTFYATKLKLTPSPVFLREAGLYPVAERFPAEQSALRERFGRDLQKSFAAEEAMRDSLAREHASTLSLQKLSELRRSSHQTEYDFSPMEALQRVAGQWVAARLGQSRFL